MHTENIQENERQENSEKELISFEEKKDIRIVSLPEEEGFEVIYVHESGSVVWRHCLVNVRSKDYEEVLEVAMDKATAGCKVHVLPTLNGQDPLRDLIFPGAKCGKCPDLKIDNIFTEIKSLTENLHMNKIINNIKKAHRQANNIIIRMPEPFDFLLLKNIVKGRFHQHSTLNIIEFKMEGLYYSFKRSDFI